MQDFLSDTTKSITSDIRWSIDEDHSPSVEFAVELHNQLGLPVLLKGSYNRLAQALSFVLILKGTGRIYALDLGADHRNPDRQLTGRKHKHRWTNAHKDRWAYVPDDITEPVNNVSGVWEQFCAEVCLVHSGVFYNPEPIQQELFV